ncbi:hypothetical protein DRW07_00110 [Alteromonas sediminis]|uniref:Polysaccharide chain length determinant N-terminal domain-containing protein n=1 Tax=Alteromonas sediminis TaxID=2259342 RepID=A0A3N5Y229_9ALTE|nr:polysaccharide biosynthesis tyrosine autokinase [Alteromonas sediminis]RPJ67857.1 hypothetical protein DRW07_00110 [Alteromonas sediminis]
MRDNHAYRVASAPQEVSFDLGDLFAFLWNTKWAIILTTTLLTCLGYMYVQNMPRLYSASAVVQLTAPASSLKLSGFSGLTGSNDSNLDAHIEMLKSRKFLKALVTELNLHFEQEFLAPSDQGNAFPSVDHAVNVLREDLRVSVVANTDMLTLTYVARSPELAASIVNTMGPLFFNYLSSKEQANAESASSWLTDQISVIRQGLDASEAALQQFMVGNNIIDVKSEMDLLQSEIVALMHQKLAADKTLSELLANKTQLDLTNGNLNSQLQVPFIANNDFIRTLRTNIQHKLTEFEEVKKRYKEKHVRYKAAAASVDEWQRKLVETVEEIGLALTEKIEATRLRQQNLSEQIGQARAQHSELGQLEIQLTRLRRDVETNQQLYSVFLARLQDAEVFQDATEQPQYAVVDEAQIPTIPVSPRVALTMAVIVILSTLFSIGLFLVLHLVSDKRSRYKRVVGRFRLSIIAEVPKQPFRFFMGKQSHAQGRYEEAIRTLRTAIIVMERGEPNRVVGITGVEHYRQNTELTLKLAESYSQVEKTLLVDANLRTAGVSASLSLDQDHLGITDIVNDKVKFSASSHRIEQSQLTVLPAGKQTQDPIATLSKPRFGSFIQKLSVFYDRLIVSVPPVQGFSDAAMLSRHADALVLLCDVTKTEPVQLSEALEKLTEAGSPVLGVVLLNVKHLRRQRF